MNLLKKYIKVFLKERFDPGTDLTSIEQHEISSDDFGIGNSEIDSDKFKNSVYGKRFKSLKEKLPLVDKGSSRAVFKINSKKIVKLALSGAGVDQNQSEYNISKQPSTTDWIPKIFKCAHDYSWLISELVRPLNSEKEFKELFGLSLYETIRFLRKGNFFPEVVEKKMKNLFDQYDSAKKALEAGEGGDFIENLYKNTENQIKSFKDPAFLKKLESLFNLFKLNQLEVNDLDIRNLGKTADGRLVVLDTGATHYVMSKWYY